MCSDHISILKDGNKRHYPEALSTIKTKDERVLQISVSGTQVVRFLFVFSLFLSTHHLTTVTLSRTSALVTPEYNRTVQLTLSRVRLGQSFKTVGYGCTSC